MPANDPELAQGLTQAKKQPRNFAIISKGSQILKMLVSKRPLADGVVAAAKRACEGTTVVRGVVAGDGGPDLVFQVLVLPSYGAVKLRTYILDATEQSYKPQFQVVESIQECDEPDESQPSQPSPPSTKSVAPEQPRQVEKPPQAESKSAPDPNASGGTSRTSKPETESFAARLKSLKDELAAIIAAGVPSSDELSRLAGELTAFVVKANLDGAKRTLERIESLLQVGRREMDAAKTRIEEQATRFTDRMKRMFDDLKSAKGDESPLGRRITTMVFEAGALAKDAVYDRAHALLDEIESLLAKRTQPTAREEEGPATPVRKFERLRKPLVARLESLEASLSGVEQAVAARAEERWRRAADAGDVSATPEVRRWETSRGAAVAALQKLAAALDQVSNQAERAVETRLASSATTANSVGLEALRFDGLRAEARRVLESTFAALEQVERSAQAAELKRHA